MLATAAVPAVPVAPGASRLRPLGLGAVTISGGFWADRQRRNGTVTIPHADRWETRLGWIGNFAAAGRGDLTRPAGREFSDSDVYKLIEAMAWEAARTGDPALEARLAELAGQISAAQGSDGYLNTHFGRPGCPPRYSDFEWGHELYCYGHLFQAAVARLRSGRPDQLVEIALRAADHVCATFGPDGRAVVCGHPEIELGLVELGRAAGRPDYVDQARLFVDRRGHGLLGEIEFGQDYFQDATPVRAAAVLTGHAVRATYLAAAALDVAAETDDHDLFEAVKAQYDSTLARRTYITGGLGSRHQGEAIGDDYELPPDRAYCETCAAIGSVMVAWRLLLATGDERYADQIERTLYNAIAVSPSQAGDAFFYANPLHRRVPGTPSDPDAVCPRAESQLRAPWFTVSCCPTNVARLTASLGAYVATVDGDQLRLHQFAPSQITADLADGRQVTLAVRTAYPDDGLVEVEVVAADPGEWALALRVPAWGEPALEGLTRSGRLAVARGELGPGTVVRMALDLAPRLAWPDSRIDAVRGTVAVERGPLVLCLESADLPPGHSADDFVLDPAAPLTPAADGAVAGGWLLARPDRDQPYGPAPDRPDRRPAETQLIPYHRWANRGPSTMRVWLPTAPPT
jgi:DUF1680 family protein